MTIALKPAHQHNYRLSAYERKANDFYPTPSDLAISFALGLQQLGLHLPRVALDPCDGDGALRRCLAPFRVDVRLSDLYPEMYQGLMAMLPANRSTLQSRNICGVHSSCQVLIAQRSSPTLRTTRKRRAPSLRT
jgi:hypothetical protein